MPPHAPDSLEARIALWKSTGEGVDTVFRAVADLIEARRGFLAVRFGAQIADEVVDDGLQKVWTAVEAGQFDHTQSFEPWLTTVLMNRCRDLHRKHGRRAVLFTDLERAGSDGFVTDFADATTHEPILDRDETPRLIAAELERILDPEPRVLFAAASGIVDYLPPAIVERWCGECHAVPQSLDAVAGLLGTPLHGRQAKLAAAFGLREATARKRYERSAGRVAEATTIVALRDLILARRRGPSS